MNHLSREQGLRLEAFGSILIITVMLTDRFLFGIQEGFILCCAVISAISLVIGIKIVKFYDDKEYRGRKKTNNKNKEASSLKT